MEKLTKYIAEISIAGKNVTGDVSPLLSRLSYTDKEEAESDDISLTFEDVHGLWQSTWYPEQGDTLQVRISQTSEMLDCGIFEIDEIEFTLAPDSLDVKGIAAAITKELRTKNNKAFEKQSLRKIANYFAGKHGLKIVGNVGKLQQIEIARKTQENQTDLSFLAGLAKEYGITFSVRGNQLVFVDSSDLENQQSILTFDRSQLSSARFKDKTAGIFDGAVTKKRNVKGNNIKKWQIKPSGQEGVKGQLVVGGQVETESQAQAKTNSALKEKNKEKVTGSLVVAGNTKLVAGVNIDLTGIGAFSGKWHVVSSSHTLDGGGYVTSVEIRKLG